MPFRHTIAAITLAIGVVACGRSENGSVRAVYDESHARELRQVTVNVEKDGKPNIFSYFENSKFTRIEIDDDEDGKIDRWEYYGPDQTLTRVGRSRANDGIADSWIVPAADGSIAKVEVATRRDGQINRTEYYEHGALARAEEDTNKDGRVDRWETYSNGGLATLSIDSAGSGKPTYTIDYRREAASR